MSETPLPRSGNRAARIGFGLWALALVVVIVALVIGATGAEEAPILASFAYAPLLLFGTVASAAALSRDGQPKRLAAVALILNIVFFLLAATVFTAAVQLITGA